MFIFQEMKLAGVYLITPKVYSDDRGYFLESYKKSTFHKNGIFQDFLQDNHSWSKKDVLRGLHFQEGIHAQGKLVRCIKGEIFDVAVDIRKNSETFGQWFGVNLSENNFYMLYIPEGFAHGFLTISKEAHVLYKTTNEYVPQADGGIIWNDPDINISWGITEPILSDKDQTHPQLAEIIKEL
ncbi:MAG: dTDP-4-dehydrorhamnose 3,5-epimerase [Candidatus Cloacimonetes bacterium]|nr:dTDP-4-dehydrorhamnose 3,5-epimerase [Candidatus Cloacimonadota bacterium]